MIDNCHLMNKNQIFAFRYFIQARPELIPLISSLLVCPYGFLPHPLLQMLPKLSALQFIVSGYEGRSDRDNRPIIQLHASTLLSYRICGKGIRTLWLHHLSFGTPFDLFRLVLAFQTLTQITCEDILIKSSAVSEPAMGLVRRKLFRQLRLETLNVRLEPGYTLWTLSILCLLLFRFTQM